MVWSVRVRVGVWTVRVRVECKGEGGVWRVRVRVECKGEGGVWRVRVRVEWVRRRGKMDPCLVYRHSHWPQDLGGGRIAGQSGVI